MQVKGLEAEKTDLKQEAAANAAKIASLEQAVFDMNHELFEARNGVETTRTELLVSQSNLLTAQAALSETKKKLAMTNKEKIDAEKETEKFYQESLELRKRIEEFEVQIGSTEGGQKLMQEQLEKSLYLAQDAKDKAVGAGEKAREYVEKLKGAEELVQDLNLKLGILELENNKLAQLELEVARRDQLVRMLPLKAADLYNLVMEDLLSEHSCLSLRVEDRSLKNGPASRSSRRRNGRERRRFVGRRGPGWRR